MGLDFPVGTEDQGETRLGTEVMWFTGYALGIWLPEFQAK